MHTHCTELLGLGLGNRRNYKDMCAYLCHNVYSFSEGDWDFGTVKYRETAMKINRFAEKKRINLECYSGINMGRGNRYFKKTNYGDIVYLLNILKSAQMFY